MHIDSPAEHKSLSLFLRTCDWTQDLFTTERPDQLLLLEADRFSSSLPTPTFKCLLSTTALALAQYRTLLNTTLCIELCLACGQTSEAREWNKEGACLYLKLIRLWQSYNQYSNWRSSLHRGRWIFTPRSGEIGEMFSLTEYLHWYWSAHSRVEKGSPGRFGSFS